MIKIGYRGLLQWEYSVFGIEKYSKRYKKYYKRTIYSGCSGRNRREHEWAAWGMWIWGVKVMSKVVTAIAELPTEALKDWREWVEANGGKVLTPRYLTEGEKKNDR